MMKTLIITTVMIATITFAGVQTVSAHGGGHHGGGYGYCDDYAEGSSAMRGRDDGDYAKFQKETADVRREIAVKRSELRALNRQDNPDEKRAAQLTGELFDLEEKLSEKAVKAGVSGRLDHGPSMMRDGVRGRFDHGPSMMRNGVRGRGDRGRHMMDW